MKRRTEHPAGASSRPPRTVPSSLGRGGEVGVFHLLADRRGERPAREPGSEVSWQWVPAPPAFDSGGSASAPRGEGEKRERERSGGRRNGQSPPPLPLGPAPRLGFFLFIPFSTDGWGKTGNDPSAGSPTETLLRLLLPLDSQV